MECQLRLTLRKVSVRLSVCPSVCPSVCQTRELLQNGKQINDDFIVSLISIKDYPTRTGFDSYTYRLLNNKQFI